MLFDVSLSKVYYGSNIIVGISSSQKDHINYFFNGVYNFNGCPDDCELEWLGSYENGQHYLAKFQTKEKRLLKCFVDQQIFFLTYPDKKQSVEIRKRAKEIAEKQMNEITIDGFLKS